ncbi:hypothetical protein ES332_D02G082100v1 [Gossypium tomentosum]|uniref:Uncharacterized protein n=1 Tax=Gossypium tomentosum TaxID=34277 RepID=A0A5D2LUK6_GOSTO|nr:hypothetical protein ES332_D02G082100v1 [Gossypium tomentosum]
MIIRSPYIENPAEGERKKERKERKEKKGEEREKKYLQQMSSLINNDDHISNTINEMGP